MVKKKDEVDEIELVSKEIEKLGGRITRKVEELRPSHYISTGIMSLDMILSDEGGIPGNAVMEVFGPNGTGKSTLAMQFACQAHKIDEDVYYLNPENSVNPSFVKSFPGLNKDKIAWIMPENGEKAIDIMVHLLQTKTRSMVILDSVPACLPAKMDDSKADETSVGAIARLFSPFMSKAKKHCSHNNNVLILLNQERAKISTMSKGGTTQPGGHAIAFYVDTRIKLERVYPNPEIKSGKDIIGHKIIVKTLKNRFTSPFRTIELPLIYGQGISVERELVEYCTMFNVIKKAGAWLSYIKEGEEDPTFKSQGIEEMADYVKQNPKVKEDIEGRLRDVLKC